MENNIEEYKLEDVNFEISNTEDVNRLTLILRRIKQIKDSICEKIDPRISDAYKAHKGLTALKKETLKPFEDAESKINNSLKQWQIKKDEEARLLKEKLDKELAEQAEKLRLEKLKEAENTDDELLKEIALEKASEIKADTFELKQVQLAVQPKIDGQYKRDNWRAKVVNPDLVPKEFWIVDEKALDRVAKLTKGETEVPGIEFWNDFSIVTKG